MTGEDDTIMPPVASTPRSARRILKKTSSSVAFKLWATVAPRLPTALGYSRTEDSVERNRAKGEQREKAVEDCEMDRPVSSWIRSLAEKIIRVQDPSHIKQIAIGEERIVTFPQVSNFFNRNLQFHIINDGSS